MSAPKDGTVLNGVFWVNEDSWLILDYTKPLKDLLTEQLAEQRTYIERLTTRADALEKWLAEHGTEKWLEKKPKP
jgi:hypothetical protein